MSESDARLSDNEEASGEDDIVRRHEHEDQENEENSEEEGAIANPRGTEELDEVNNDNDDDGDDADNETAKKVDPASSKKRTVRKLIVLNADRLKGRKGVHTIEKLYQGFQFKGKGGESEDLDRVMKRLEYWAFRIFPKLEFDDFLAKCESIGHKKELQVHLKKYRLGMISADDEVNDQNEFIEDEQDDEDDPDIGRREEQLRAQIANDDFQRLYDESAPVLEENS